MNPLQRLIAATAIAAAVAQPGLAAGQTMLHDQLISNADYGLFANDVVAPEFLVTHSSEGGDDFVVGDAGGWSVSGFRFSAYGPGGSTPPPALNVKVFNDEGSGVPGSELLCFAPGISGSYSGAPDYHVDVTLPVACDLPAGRYWVVWSFANVQLTSGIFGFWGQTTAQNEQPAVWRNPGGTFQSACMNWSTFAQCPSLIDPAWGLKDFGFAVIGDIHEPAEVTLHDQLISNTDYGLFANDVVAPEFLVTHSSEGGDDFVVGDADGWSVSEFRFSAYGAGGSTPPPALNVKVFNDEDSGVPGSELLCFAPGVSGSYSGAPDYHVDVTLPVACDLPAGRYWVVWSFANVQLTSGIFGFWGQTTAQNEQPAVWRNPGGTFQSACMNWSTFAQCPSLIDPAWGLKDFGFAVRGVRQADPGTCADHVFASGFDGESPSCRRPAAIH